ncbi:esterase [Mycolicibacterium sp. 018/SC-01/001]|uniref:alpha/beta hydrolase family esterase n=1 Tax=Mycolicibacterium sp. 018/SC-01/001 TaxID=2592069 RepID=UPI00117D3C27|nr:PHB depolymerase family esterase [Mycolicibacterium sp. 018/SC-01/001]TRW82178.1 esterase [Mycolicibacterium sp. 018/SC-01/001]
MLARALTALAAAVVTVVASAVPAGAAPGPAQGLLQIGGLQRTYSVHVPPGPVTGLVINLHGAGQTGRDQEAFTNYDAVADRYGFVVAYPDGVDMSWADGRGGSVPERQGVDDVSFLSTLITQLTGDYGVNPGRVFVTGMSAGGFMAQRLACDRADLVAAVVSVAGTLGATVPCAPSRPVSVLAVHGDADPVVPFGGGPMVGRGGPSVIVSAPDLVDRWRAIDGCPPPVVTPGRASSTGCADGTAVELVVIGGGGHVWPTGFGFDASQAGADFLAAHGR